MKRLLVIGAGGFVGGFIASTGIERGFDVTVGVRASTSRRYLSDPRLHFLELDYANPDVMQRQIADALPVDQRWDYIIYNLGATKCRCMADFEKINCGYLENFIAALKALPGKAPDKFLFMSSLSAMGPQDEKGYTPISLKDTPRPNTFYARSKIKAEEALKQSGFDYIIFRATGVYGPREKDYLMMIKSIDSHIDVGMGYRRQMLTFIYVDDLVNAMFDALAAGVSRRTYIIAEPQAYTQKEFRAIVSEELGGRWVVPLKLPMFVVYAVSAMLEKFAAWRGTTSTLNRDKYKIMKQRNWDCDVSEAVADFGFHADFPLRRGVHETVKAYLAEKKTK